MKLAILTFILITHTNGLPQASIDNDEFASEDTNLASLPLIGEDVTDRMWQGGIVYFK